MNEALEQRIGRIGGGVLRWSLVLIFTAFGLYKFTAEEAAAIAPLVNHSPFFFWATPLLGQQGISNLIGVIELATAALIALRRLAPMLSAYGSLAAAVSLVVTLSFLFTTPGMAEDPTAGFIVKDLTLLGAALWTAAEAFAAARARN